MALARSPTPGELQPGAVPPEPVVWREGRLMVVALRGEQDMSTAARVAEAIAGAAALGAGDVVVDLGGVQFMDASIVGVLVGGGNDLRSQDRRLTVRTPSPRAQVLLDLCGLDPIIDPRPEAGRDDAGSCATVPGTWSSTGGPR